MGKRILNIPCLVPIFRGKEDVLFIKLMIPNMGTVAWVNPSIVTILRQQANVRDLQGLLRTSIEYQDDMAYKVRFNDRGISKQLTIPKSWLVKEPADEEGEK